MDDFEKIRDDLEATIRKAYRRHYAKDLSVFTKEDLGIKHIEHVDEGYDHGATDQEIQRALNQLTTHVHMNERENRAHRFLGRVASNGFYGYLKLRKALGYPLETFTVKQWYGQRLPELLPLVNPAGLVFLSEGLFAFASVATIKQGQGVEGVGKQASILKPTVNTHIFKIDPTTKMGEAGVGVTIKNMKFYDEDTMQTNTSAVVLDGTNNQVGNVMIKDALFEKVYDGIINIPKTGTDPWSDDLWCWHHTLKNLTFVDFKRYGIHWQNVADVLHDNVWLVSTLSSVPAILVEKVNPTSPYSSFKIGGNTFKSMRVFNEKSATPTAHGLNIKDTGEMWMDDVISEASGKAYWLQGCWNIFASQCWGVGYSPDNCLEVAWHLDPVDNSHFENCIGYNAGKEGFLLHGKTRYNVFSNCQARNNSQKAGENKCGITLWGMSANDKCEHNHFVNCKSFDDQTVHTQYGGVLERDAYTDWNFFLNTLTFGNTTVTHVLNGVNSKSIFSNEIAIANIFTKPLAERGFTTIQEAIDSLA